jgi:hypothetical protein
MRSLHLLSRGSQTMSLIRSFITLQVALLIAFWGAGLPVIMNPTNAIAVAGETVIDANLYFFSWLSFASTLYLSGSLAQEAAGVDITKTPPKSARWYGLCASSLVVMGASVRLFKAAGCGSNNTQSSGELCKRTKFAISAGTIGFVFALVMTYLTQQGLAIVMETVATMILLALWCFGVGYITFGSAPGAQIGNLYFATWISFIICVFLFGQCFREVIGARQANAVAQQNGDGEGGTDEPQAFPQVPEEEDQI